MRMDRVEERKEETSQRGEGRGREKRRQNEVSIIREDG